MNTATFPCPYCSSPLRIRDRAFVETEVGCPECGERIEVTLDRDHEPIAHKVPAKNSRKASPDAIPPRRKPKKLRFKSKRKQETFPSNESSNGKGGEHESTPNFLLFASRKSLIALRGKLSWVPEIVFTPVGIAWMVAGLVGLTLLILAWPGGEKPGDAAISTDAAETWNPDPSLDGSSFEDAAIQDQLLAMHPPGPVADVEQGEVAARYSALNQSIKRYVDQHGQFPAGTVSQGNQPVKNRFGWLAELYVKDAGGRFPEPQWDQPWNDPLNDRFVRQQREPYLNPLITRRVGPDRYPATHFVGVAGVGADAAMLPVDHPRAGIFGVDRNTRPEDVKDGMANTLMVAGVMNQLGSWAAGGRPTLRGFTQEPYFEGPDGFGTGEADGMSVLMADGSVRFLSKTTAPVIVRRMAAMADGWPLDETNPGEPGDVPSPEIAHPNPPAIAQAEPQPEEAVNPKPEQPMDPLPPEKEPESEQSIPVDIPAALAVKILKFEQVKEAPFQELLYQVEELCGVPIRRAADLPAADAEFWKKGVSLSLKDASVRQILETLLEKFDLEFTIESDHIQLHAGES